MESSVDINELANKITKEISESNDIQENDFKKIIELEKLNKKLKKQKLKETNIESESEKKEVVPKKKNFFYSTIINLKKILIETIILIILFIIVNHKQFEKIINYIPLECFKTNDIINLLLKGSILSIIYRLLLIIVN